MSAAVRTCLATAIFALIAFVVLGVIVTHAPPGFLDRSELGAYGVAVPLARFFTGIGRFPCYVVLCLTALAFGAIRRAWLGRAIVSVAGLLVVWQSSDIAKVLFHRARPENPILAETSFAYPSGHATLAIFFYGIWASYVWQSELVKPLRIALVTPLVFWIAAIGWSRLALGAHYPSDVLGGYLLGAACLAGVRAFVAARSRAKRHLPGSGSGTLID